MILLWAIALMFSVQVFASEDIKNTIPGQSTYKFPSLIQIVKYIETRKNVLCATRMEGSIEVLVSRESCRKEIDLQLKKLTTLKGMSQVDIYRQSLVEFKKRYFE